MDGEHIMYLSSSGSLDIYPNNKPNAFTNRLAAPISLNTNLSYEIGLASILYPDEYYAIVSGDNNFTIELKTTQNGQPTYTHAILMEKSILAGSMNKIIKVINKNLIEGMNNYYYDFFPHLVNEDKIILTWNKNEGRCEIICKYEAKPDHKQIGDVVQIDMYMNSGIANILGFKSQEPYTIFSIFHKYKNVSSTLPPTAQCGVDYMHLHTDIIEPTNFGGQLVNILDCFTMKGANYRGIHNTIYKPLNTHYIDQISIYTTDQNGRPIPFREESTLTCVLHIRTK